MPEFVVRAHPHFQPDAAGWGADVESDVVDNLSASLGAALERVGLQICDYSGAPEKLSADAIANSPVAMLHGVELAQKLNCGVKATGYFRGERVLRKEAVVIDDGGTRIFGREETDVDNVLKIAVRDADGTNRDIRDLVEESLSDASIDPSEAKNGVTGEEGTVVYALKRFTPA